jgi:integrase
MTFRTKAEADLWLSAANTDAARGEWVDPDAGKVPLREYAAEWMDAKPSLAPKTVELYAYLLDAWILTYLGDSPLKGLTPMRVRAWRAEVLRLGRPGPSTVAKAYRLLSSILRTAAADNLIVRNPCTEKGAGAEHAKERRVASPREIAMVAEAIEPRYRALVLTAAYAGCRWGELAGLKQRNLDLLHLRLTVSEQAIELGSGERVVAPPKTSAGRRVVNLPAGVVAALELHLAEFVQTNPDELVFTTETGAALRQSNFRNRHWSAAVKAAGVEGLRFHDLRHVAGTLATVSGATIREVQARLGHASPAAAYRYQHVLDNRDAEIAEKLDALMRAARTEERARSRKGAGTVVRATTRSKAD